MALMIAGERSGSGKTTITLALLAALQRRSQRVQSFKVGPDYIDPMFHRAVTGRPCRNLDPILTSEAYVQACFAHHSSDAEFALVEGVMGLFDGASATQDLASTAHIAQLLNLPILLVLDCSHLSRSVAAIVHGYQTFDPTLHFAGVVLNRVGSDRHLDLLKAALEPLHLPILGVFRRQDQITIPDRHLGLMPTDELDNLKDLFDRLADLGATCFDWSALTPLLAPPSTSFALPSVSAALPGLRIAVARDRAFNFYYADNLDLLEQLGAELSFWSPMQDTELPEGIQGLYLGGGFPEVFAEALMQNHQARSAVRSAIQSGMPTYAECGGLMYLTEKLMDFEQKSWDMVGIFPTVAQMGQRLTLGYRQAMVLQDSPLLAKHTTVWGHEFHRSVIQQVAPEPLYQLQGLDPQGVSALEGWRSHQVHASYVHLHWGAQPEIPARFLRHCAQFSLALHSSR